MENPLFSEARGLPSTTAFESRSDRPLLKETNFRYPPFRRAAKPRLFNSLSVVAVVSLTFLFLIFRCFQHISNNVKLGLQLRALATGGDDEFSCLGWQGGEDSSDGESGEEEEPSADTPGTSAGTAERGAMGRHGMQGGGLRDPSVFARGWGFWQMPFEWQDQLEYLMIRLTAAATQCAKLLPRLSPQQGVSLVRSLSYLAVLELSGFAYIPSRIQHVREQAGAAYMQLLESILTDEAAAELIARSRARGNFECLQRLFGAVIRRPETELNLSAASFKASIICHWKVCSYSLQQIEQALSGLAHSDGQLGISPRETQDAIRLFQALFAVRKRQVLRRPLTKNWLVFCQRNIGVFLLFTKSEFRTHSAEPKQRARGMLEEIMHAVEHQGGTPLLPTAAEPPFPTTLSVFKEYMQDVTAAQGLAVSTRRFPRSPLDDSSQQPSTSLPSVSHPAPSQIPPAAEDEPAQSSAQASHSPQDASQAAAQPEGITSASPTTETTTAGLEASEEEPQLRPRAWYIATRQGWGIRRMPLRWETNLVHMMNKMSTVAVRCVVLIPSLRAEDVVLLAMHLSSMAAVEVAAFGYIPSSLQPKRAEVGASYVQLIDRVLAPGSSTLRAAQTLGLEDRLMSLSLFLREASLEPPLTDVIQPSAYKRKICVQYMVSRYAFQRTLDLVNSLFPVDTEQRTHVHEPMQVIEACAGMLETLRMHLFGNSFLRNWFNICQRRVGPYILMTKKEYRDLGLLRMKKTEEVLYELDEAIRNAGCILPPIQFGDDSSPRESSLDQETEEQLSEQLSTAARVTHPPPQVLEQPVQLSQQSDVSFTPGASALPGLPLTSPAPPYSRVGEQSASSLQPSAPFRARASRPAQRLHPSSAPSLPSLVQEFPPSSRRHRPPQSPDIQQISYPTSPSSRPSDLMVSSPPRYRPPPPPSPAVPHELMTLSPAISSAPQYQTPSSFPTLPTAFAVPPTHVYVHPPQQVPPFQVGPSFPSHSATFVMPPSPVQPPQFSVPFSRQTSTPSPAPFQRIPFPAGPSPSPSPAAFVVSPLHVQHMQPSQLTLPLSHHTSTPSSAELGTRPFRATPGPSSAPAPLVVPPPHEQLSQVSRSRPLERSIPQSADSSRSSSWAGLSLPSDTAAFTVPPPPGFGPSSSRSLFSHQTRAPSSAEPRSQPLQPAPGVSPPLPLRLPQEASIWAALPQERALTEARSERASLPSAVPRRASSPQALEQTSVTMRSLQYSTEPGAQTPFYGGEDVPEQLLLPHSSIGPSGASGEVVEASEESLSGLETQFTGWSVSDLAEGEEDS
ncbi:hypothetical protein Emed_001194 [Eimeria media]